MSAPPLTAAELFDPARRLRLDTALENAAVLLRTLTASPTEKHLLIVLAAERASCSPVDMLRAILQTVEFLERYFAEERAKAPGALQ